MKLKKKLCATRSRITPSLMVTIVIGVIIATLTGCSLFPQKNDQPAQIETSPSSSNESLKEVVFSSSTGETSVFVEVADTNAKREQGLMNRTEMSQENGMLFILDFESRPIFWMKDTLISLDIIFINKDNEIVYIAQNTKTNQTNEVYQPDAKSKYVIEVNAGWTNDHGINVGDRVNLNFLEQ